MAEHVGSQPAYKIINGVELRPGVHVFIWDRDDYNYDSEGVIASIKGRRYKVRFGGGASDFWYDLDQIMVTHEEQQSDSARAWRAERALKVFLCHAQEDKPRIRELYAHLAAMGFQPWLDEQDIPPGSVWEDAIRLAVQNSHVVLVCLSRAAVQKAGYVQKEIRFILDRADEMPEGRVYVIPLRLDDCLIPTRLSQWQYLDLHKEDAETRLVTVLRECARQLKLWIT